MGRNFLVAVVDPGVSAGINGGVTLYAVTNNSSNVTVTVSAVDISDVTDTVTAGNVTAIHLPTSLLLNDSTTDDKGEHIILTTHLKVPCFHISDMCLQIRVHMS